LSTAKVPAGGHDQASRLVAVGGKNVIGQRSFDTAGGQPPVETKRGKDGRDVFAKNLERDVTSADLGQEQVLANLAGGQGDEFDGQLQVGPGGLRQPLQIRRIDRFGGNVQHPASASQQCGEQLHCFVRQFPGVIEDKQVRGGKCLAINP
jgi:hypothetical protein